MEVFAQLKADNPASMIRILPTEELTWDFALNDLVIIGGAAAVYAAIPWLAQDIPLPRARPIPGTDTYAFTCSVGNERRVFEFSSNDGSIVEDVGLVARWPHPIDPERVVTVLDGLTSRGVQGAALCFIDQHVKDDNERYLQETHGESNSFCILMRVPVYKGFALPSNLSRDDVRLYEWSTITGTRW